MISSQSAYHTIRGLRYHVRSWGKPGWPRIFLLHGWMDVSASFQFLVDALQQEWHVIAPDWRGFGLTGWNQGVYWFPDYLADLDALLALYSPGEPARLAGHSMGGNVALLYAGVRPDRVRRVASLEGFGIPRTTPDMAPAKFAEWLQQLANPPGFQPYASFDQVAERLKKNNPRLSDEKARFLATHWARRTDSGEVVLRSDPAHKITNATLYRLEEAMACWRRVECPVLWVAGADRSIEKWTKDTPGQFAERKACFRNFAETEISDAGHMMHHDQPEALARLIEAFFG
ncbi:MAG: alpha/beta hydrolase [Betaproteobacteria bacterium]|nr:alpha/beta hydrolase [Betaproteobacteria bacterium]